MKGFPVNIVNLICSWAAQEDIDWYPFFCPKTHKLHWKVNKYSKKFREKGDIILHNRLDSYMIEGMIDIHIGYGWLQGGYNNLKYRAIKFQYMDSKFGLYIEVEPETDLSQNEYIFRTMLSFEQEDEGGNLIERRKNSNFDLFLNGTNFGLIYDGWYNYGRDNKIVLLAENY